MSSATGLLRALTLVLAILLGSAPASSGAQETDYSELDGEGLQYHLVATREGGDGTLWEQYQFFFEPTAAVPEFAYPEAMIVKVISGSFAFRVGAEDIVVVDPHGQSIPFLNDPSGDPLVASVEETGEVVQDDDGDCTTLCIIPPGETVRVEQGSTVYLPGLVSCWLCNIGLDTFAELMVIAAVPSSDAPFSWTRLEGATDLDQPTATPQAALNPQPMSAASTLYVGCR